MATGERNDPYRGYNFVIEIDGIDVGGFSEANGLSFDVDPIDYREGTDRQLHVRKLTGLRKFANVTLKRGFTADTQLWDWYLEVLNGVVERKNGSITLRDEEYNDVLRWEFEEGWICKWEGPTMNASGNDVAIESIEICVERVELT